MLPRSWAAWERNVSSFLSFLLTVQIASSSFEKQIYWKSSKSSTRTAAEKSKSAKSETRWETANRSARKSGWNSCGRQIRTLTARYLTSSSAKWSSSSTTPTRSTSSPRITPLGNGEGSCPTVIALFCGVELFKTIIFSERKYESARQRIPRKRHPLRISEHSQLQSHHGVRPEAQR